jgi:hypothetical protein
MPTFTVDFQNARYIRGRQMVQLLCYPGRDFNLCLRLVGDVTLSINVAGMPGAKKLQPTQIALKTYSECEGIEKDLLASGVIAGAPVQAIRSGFVTIPVYELSAAFLRDYAEPLSFINKRIAEVAAAAPETVDDVDDDLSGLGLGNITTVSLY